jgi:hypothetical protein
LPFEEGFGAFDDPKDEPPLWYLKRNGGFQLQFSVKMGTKNKNVFLK